MQTQDSGNAVVNMGVEGEARNNLPRELGLVIGDGVLL